MSALEIMFFLGLETGALCGFVVAMLFSKRDYVQGYNDAWNNRKKEAYAMVSCELRNSICGDSDAHPEGFCSWGTRKDDADARLSD